MLNIWVDVYCPRKLLKSCAHEQIRVIWGKLLLANINFF